MSASWRKVENENGFPFYINETTSSKQWDHPKYNDIKQRLDECNYVKYASYRVASKFRVLQQALYMNDVPLDIVRGVFDRHRLGATESSLCLESYDLEAVLSDIHFASNKHNHTNVDVDFASELTLTFLYNVFDKERKSNIDVSSTKLLLALLSNCKLMDLYKFIFTLCSDHNNCVTRLRLQSLLSKICRLTTYLNESTGFGQHLIGTAMENCFSNNPGLVGVNECTFITWIESVPQLFSWLPIMHRFKLSETVLHNAKCSVCKLSPLLGMRYQCVKCSRYIQCQKCFLSGRISHSHKLSHTMKEHCRESSAGHFTKGITKKLSSLIKCAYVVNENCIADVNIIKAKPISSTAKDFILKALDEEISTVEPLSSPLSQLQVVIRQLELQNRELQQMLVIGARSNKDMKHYLEQHRLHVATQIQKLKTLKDYMHTPETQITTTNPLESTPMVSNNKISSRILKGLDLFSPIPQIQELSINEKEETVLPLHKTYNDEMHDFSLAPYSIRDISTWIGGQPTTSTDYNKHADINQPAQSDLDDALVKLQQILANNFSLDESLGTVDNCQLKNAVTEVEGMLSSIIDNAESNKISVANISKNDEYLNKSYSYFAMK